MKTRNIPAVLLLFVLASCKTDFSPDSYEVGSVGTVNRAVEGVIISVREVKIQGNTGTGAAAGGIAGGVGGAAVIGGGDGASAVVGAIGGALVGALAGNAIEKRSSKQRGYSYVVKTGNGSLLTLVQGADVKLKVGQRVIVEYGPRSRIIPYPEKKEKKE